MSAPPAPPQTQAQTSPLANMFTPENNTSNVTSNSTGIMAGTAALVFIWHLPLCHCGFKLVLSKTGSRTACSFVKYEWILSCFKQQHLLRFVWVAPFFSAATKMYSRMKLLYLVNVYSKWLMVCPDSWMWKASTSRPNMVTSAFKKPRWQRS